MSMILFREVDDKVKRFKEDFNDILEKQRIRSVFQPIVSLKNGEIVGYEALSRIVEPKEISCSEELFHLAGIYGKVWELEQLCRGKILETYHSLQNKGKEKLFLNVNPMVIHDKEFRAGFTSEYLKQYGLDLNNIVFEVTERNSVDDIKGFKDPIKYAMVKSMVEFANLTNIQLVAEGIECEEELKALLKLGVHNGQGFLLRKPDEELKGVEKSALDIIYKYNRKKAAKLKKCNAQAQEYRAVLFRFENYKAYGAYCEKYGDEKGDHIIDLIQNIVEQNLLEDESAILLGEDGVLTVFEKEHYKNKSEVIINLFKNRIQKYYGREEIERGYIERKNKRGENKKYPIISICSERVI